MQLTGGNDFMNTLVPYSNGHYYDSRKTLVVRQDEALPINDQLGYHPEAAPLKELYDAGKVAVVQGIGYANSSRSHFRAMDIWHTCEPEKVGTEGWLGRALRDLDPRGENVLTGVHIGRALPRALALAGVPVTSVNDLDNYGLMSGISDLAQRNEALGHFRRIYTPAVGTAPVMDYLARTGTDVLRGADQLKAAPARYSSTVQYPDNPIAKSLRDVARVHLAGLGSRILYTAQGGYDTHANQGPTHPKLLGEVSGAIRAFFADLKEHDASDEVVMLVFTEFGRRIRDNGSGTDHGSAAARSSSASRSKAASTPNTHPSNHRTGSMAKTCVTPSTSAASIPPSWSSGLASTPPQSSAAPTSRYGHSRTRNEGFGGVP
jgi:uncharacterized protein (DUF1501 family)